VLYHAHL